MSSLHLTSKKNIHNKITYKFENKLEAWLTFLSEDNPEIILKLIEAYPEFKALYEDGFDGPIRPDHGRMIWGEKAMPGYGLYDRALGAAYLRGLWEAAKKEGEQR